MLREMVDTKTMILDILMKEPGLVVFLTVEENKYIKTETSMKVRSLMDKNLDMESTNFTMEKSIKDLFTPIKVMEEGK